VAPSARRSAATERILLRRFARLTFLLKWYDTIVLILHSRLPAPALLTVDLNELQLEVEGRPGRTSSSIDIRPCLNLLYHSSVVVRLIVSSPNTFCNVSKISVKVFPNLKQSFTHTRCLFKLDIPKYRRT
jgi:hypothetical protein